MSKHLWYFMKGFDSHASRQRSHGAKNYDDKPDRLIFTTDGSLYHCFADSELWIVRKNESASKRDLECSWPVATAARTGYWCSSATV